MTFSFLPFIIIVIYGAPSFSIVCCKLFLKLFRYAASAASPEPAPLPPNSGVLYVSPILNGLPFTKNLTLVFVDAVFLH